MFYFLSKIIGLFLNPLVWISGLLLFSVFSKNTKRSKKSRISAIVILLLFSNSMLYNEVCRLWEIDATQNTELHKNYDVGIVLSGMTHYNADLNRMNFIRSSDRIWQAVRLYKAGRIDKILITGGAASFFSKDTVESVKLSNFIQTLGISSEDIMVETLAKNTYENAQFTAKILDTTIYTEFLLITSATHMRRSAACFKKAGLECHLYPSDHYTKARTYHINQILVPNAETLSNWDSLLHELFGMLSYKLAGYI